MSESRTRGRVGSGRRGRRVPEIALEGELSTSKGFSSSTLSTMKRRSARPTTPVGPSWFAALRLPTSSAPCPAPRSLRLSSVTRSCSGSTSRSSPMARPIVATYSIAACDLETGQWGVATQSKFLAVGSVVPWAEPHIGAIATQAYANPRYGPDVLRAPAKAPPAEEVVEWLDSGRRRPRPPAASGSSTARAAARRYTGSSACMDWAGGKAGLVLCGPGEHPCRRLETVDALASTFASSAGKPLAERLIEAPRRCPGRGRRPARPAVRCAPRGGERRWLREAHRCARRPAGRRPPGPDLRARTALPPARPALRQDAAGQLAGGRRRLLAPSLVERLAALGYTGELDQAFYAWSATENLEERVDGVASVDPVALAELRAR